MKVVFGPKGLFVDAAAAKLNEEAALSIRGPGKRVIAQLQGIDSKTWERLKRAHVAARRLAADDKESS